MIKIKIIIILAILCLRHLPLAAQCESIRLPGSQEEIAEACCIDVDLKAAGLTHELVKSIYILNTGLSKAEISSSPIDIVLNTISENQEPQEIINTRKDFLLSLKTRGIIVLVNILFPEVQGFYSDSAKRSISKYLTKSLLPVINKSLSNKQHFPNPIISGIYEGADLALYLALTEPGIFDKAGIFSPRMLSDEGLEQIARNLDKSYKNKIFFFNLAQEYEESLKRLERITDVIGLQTSVMIYKILDEKPSDEINPWRRWYPEFLQWMYAPGYNYVLKDLD